MAANKIPVSFDFFKKYTYHEEWVDFIFKTKANGDRLTYEALVNNEDCKQKALRAYYEAFYLKPKIREKYHIRIKPVPKNIKDKLLLIPLLDKVSEDAEKDTANRIAGVHSNTNSNVILEHAGSNVNKGNSKRRFLLPSQDICNEDYVVDDTEPLSSPNTTSNFKENNAKLNSSLDIVKNKERIAASSEDEEKKIIKTNEENPKTSNNMQQNEGNTVPSNKKPNFNYKDLIPYIHCCPLTLKEFRKYSNINQLVKEFCEKQKIDAIQQRIILQRSYILFYLAPEHRKITPIDKIQLLDHCPPHIKDKFFSIPATLYLKDTNKNTPKVVNKSTGNANGESICMEAISSKTEPHAIVSDDVSEQKSKLLHNNNSSENVKSLPKQKIINSSKTTDPVLLNTGGEDTDHETQLKCKPIATTQTSDSIACINSKETNDCIQTNVNSASTVPAVSFLNIPISLEEFKNYTLYEDIVEKLFKAKAQCNEGLYMKYKNSEEAFEKTLENYYQAFYLLPAIREILPIRFKSIPMFLKSRLLQIPEGINIAPLPNFKVEQLVSPEFQCTPVNEKELSTAGTSPLAKSVVDQSKERDAVNKSNNCSTSLPNSTVITIKMENDTESSDSDKSNLPLSGIKRASNEVNEPSPPKRQKIQQTQDYVNGSKNTKSCYNDLLPYAHCCPVSFSEFTKYTNISELFRGYCQKRYNSVRKLPFMLKRAYILYYLAPKNRNLKPFNKLKVRDTCPIHLREKIFSIPASLYLKEEQTNEFVNEKRVGADKTTCRQRESQTTDSDRKEHIEILENRLLPPTTLCFSRQCNEISHCSNDTCVFHHISHFDFMKFTNILNILPEPQEITTVENIFKKFVYKIVKEQCCDERFVVNCALLCKLLKYKEICEKCEDGVKTILNLDTTNGASQCESESTSKANNETVIERCDVNDERIQSNRYSSTMKEQTNQIAVINKSSTTNPTAQLTNTVQTQQETRHLWKYLKNDKIFAKFCQKLLTKLNQSFDDTVDFSADTYTIFLQCNDLPLKQILNNFCEDDEDIVENILNNSEIYEALQRYYYYKYLTNTNFALNYPVKIKRQFIKESPNNAKENDMKSTAENNHETINNSMERREVNMNSSNSVHVQEDNSKIVSYNQEKYNNIALEKAKRIFFRNVEKTNTLSYVLRTSFGLKQLILRTVLSLTFKDFLDLTAIYEGEELYTDSHVAECMYRYVFHTPLVWPTNLYIRLENLCKLLHSKSLRFDDYATMLKHISPKLLHWSTLLSCTNIVDCVRNYFERRTGKVLDTYDTKSLKQECIEYYNRCWKHEKWLEEVPLVNEDFYTNLLENSQVPNFVSAVNAEATAKIDTTNGERPVEEFNCVMLPNTQQQIEMLPAEEKFSPDPLTNCNSELNLDVSSSTNENYEVISLGELTESIKTEPIDKKLLSNLLFYEDNNSNMQCSPCEEDIIDLDCTLISQVVTENLPPSQIDFVETVQDRILNDISVNSDSSNSFMNLGQQIPSSVTSTDINSSTHSLMQQPQTAQISSTQLIKLPDVSLRSSGENEVSENVLEEHSQQLMKTNAGQETNQCGILQNVPTNLGTQTFPSTLEDTQMYSGSLSGGLQQEQVRATTAEDVAETISSPLSEQQVNIIAKQTVITTSNNIQPLRTYATIKSKKNVAKVKPLKNSDLVPQIQHNTRPLQTKPAHTCSSGKDNPAVRPGLEILSPASVVLSATPTTSGSNSTGQSTQSSTFHLHSSALGTHIYISQEFNKNLSVFDNTSLLRIVDQNYHQQNPTNIYSATSQTSTGEPPANSNTVEKEQNDTSEQTDLRIITRRNSMTPDGNNDLLKVANTVSIEINSQVCTSRSNSKTNLSLNTNEKLDNTNEQSACGAAQNSSLCLESSAQANTISSLLDVNTTSDTQHQEQCRGIVTRITSNLHNDSNDKVNNNNLALIQSNNHVCAFTPNIQQPHYHHSYQMVRRLCLYRKLIKFHYFKRLTPQHISQYLLPSLEIGKSYTEALVISENFKSRISNRSISALFPFWPQNIQRDFLLVLNELKEFHYDVYERDSLQKEDDLRVSILFSLLSTAPSFSLCQFIYEANNTEFSLCEALKSGNDPSYKRRPFKCLTNALSSKVLNKLRKMKLELKRNL